MMAVLFARGRERKPDVEKILRVESPESFYDCLSRERGALFATQEVGGPV